MVIWKCTMNKKNFEGEFLSYDEVSFTGKNTVTDYKTVYLVEVSFSAKVDISRFDIFLSKKETLTGWLWQDNKKNINTVKYSDFSESDHNKIFDTLEHAEEYTTWLMLNGFSKGDLNVLQPMGKEPQRIIDLDDLESKSDG